MKRTVLCVVELENYPEDVVARATELAKLHDCDLELVLSDPASNYLGESFVMFAEMQMFADTIRNEQQAMLQNLAIPAEDLGITVRTSTSHERPEANMIAARAQYCDARFVVKGTHHHSPTERASLAHTDWQLIRKLECPLWFVKPGKWKTPIHVVAAVDPLHKNDKQANFDRKIIEYARDIANKYDGDLTLFHAYQRLEEIGARVKWSIKPERLPVDQLDDSIREEHKKALQALATACDVAEGAVHQLPGRTEDLLPTFARANGASVVVMGALARSGLKKRILGNTAARVLDQLPCDVLVIHG
jgi:universal stress protein E